MYVVIKNIENDDLAIFSMLASNGTYTSEDLTKAVIFPTVELATKQKEVLAGLNPNDTFSIKEIVLEDVDTDIPGVE